MINDTLLSFINKADDSQFKKNIQAIPVASTPIITKSDARRKFITRYFVRLSNDITYITEVNETQYEELKQNPRFVTTSLEWKIIGKKETLTLSSGVPIYGVDDTNRITVADADLTFGGLRSYITNYLEFWIAEE